MEQENSQLENRILNLEKEIHHITNVIISIAEPMSVMLDNQFNDMVKNCENCDHKNRTLCELHSEQYNNIDYLNCELGFLIEHKEKRNKENAKKVVEQEKRKTQKKKKGRVDK